jgi:PAS domain-containing protein
MNNNGMTSITIPVFSAEWFFLPPVTAIGTAAAVSLASGGGSAPVDAAIWGLTGFLFIILTILYGLFVQRGFHKGLLPVQLMAQGLLLCPLSLSMGARMFQWVGVTMTACGAVILVVLYYRSLTAFASVLQATETSSGLDVLPIPFAITDEEGNIISVSDALLQMTKQSRDKALGNAVTLLFPLDGESVALDGKEWKIIQSRMPENKYYFQLEEAQSPNFAPMPLLAGSEAEAVEPTTMLHSRAYAARCTKEELYRVRRYRRWVSVVLLRMVFRGKNPPEKEKEEEIFNAYCRFVGSSVREIDTACLVGPRDIYVIMPETPLEGARVAVSKLADFTSHLQEHLQEFNGTIDVLDKLLFFDPAATNNEIIFEDIIERMSSALGNIKDSEAV